MRNCIFCRIEKAARDEFMEFLNWFAKTKPNEYVKIMTEYSNTPKHKIKN